MGFFDDLFSDDGEKPIARIKGRHCFGFNLSKDATITVELFENRIVYKNKGDYLSEDKMEDVFSVEGIYKDIDKGSITTATEESGFASNLALMKGDWTAAMALKPGKTTYITTPQIERHYFLDTSSMKNCVTLEIDDKDDLLHFLDKCEPILDKYLRAEEEEREEIRKAIEKEEKNQNVSLDSMTDTQFNEFCVNYLDNNGFINVVLLPKSVDSRVTIVAEKDKVKYAIRCVNTNKQVKAEIIGEIESGRKHYLCHVGVVMTTSTFSDEAKKSAEENIIFIWDKSRLQ